MNEDVMKVSELIAGSWKELRKRIRNFRCNSGASDALHVCDLFIDVQPKGYPVYAI